MAKIKSKTLTDKGAADARRDPNTNIGNGSFNKNISTRRYQYRLLIDRN